MGQKNDQIPGGGANNFPQIPTPSQRVRGIERGIKLQKTTKLFLQSLVLETLVHEALDICNIQEFVKFLKFTMYQLAKIVKLC